MQFSEYSTRTGVEERKPHHNAWSVFVLMTGFLLSAILCTAPAMAESNQSISIDPIGSHSSGEKFNITGSTTIPSLKKIGIEIFPKAYWDAVSEYAKTDDAGRVIFREKPSTTEDYNPTGINLVRFNQDGTQSYEPFEKSPDHWTTIVSVEKSSAAERRWSVDIEKNENKTPFSPGTYHVNIWDASTQVQHPGNTLGNGWDIINKKIYPSTARANVWDIQNQKDVESAEFTIRGA